MGNNRPIALGVLSPTCFSQGIGARGGTYSFTPSGTQDRLDGWIHGGVDGLDWGDVKVVSGVMHGNNTSGSPPYSDPTALLPGVWGVNQTVQATVKTTNQQGAINQEVECRLRSHISPHICRGYEVLFRCQTNGGGWYGDIVRWNGPLNDFTALLHATGFSLVDNDVIKATITGAVIKGFINDVEVMSYDTTSDTAPSSGAGPARYTSGLPGIGFFQNNGSASLLTDFGLRDVTITAP